MLSLLPLLFAACAVDETDFDGDGAPDALDCAPEDPTVYPGAPDEFGDGVDKNCDSCPGVGPVDGIDRDCDGYPSNVERGEGNYDCDDNDATVHPGAADPDDGIDQDCSEVEGFYACPDADADGFCEGVDDCDDADPAVHRGAEELVDCVDNNCDGRDDEGLSTFDNDHDGACVGADIGAGLQCCDVAVVPGDCDDASLMAHPLDHDGDGADTCGPDGLPGSGDEDCDDFAPARRPGLSEACDGVDNDCDGVTPVDELDEDGDGLSACGGDCDDADATVYPWDVDLDGSSPCDGDCDDGDDALRPTDADGDGVSTCGGDCDDGDADVFPGAMEVCNDIDDDCDGAVPADNLDADNDGFPECDDCDDTDPLLVGRDADGDGVTVCDGDCDDGNPAISPNELDLAGDGLDQDCDGVDGLDGDADGFASVGTGGADCDDADPGHFPGAPEICDGVDGNCDGDADTDIAPIWYLDGDGDGDGDPAGSLAACVLPAGYVATDGDCAPADPAVYSAAVEVPRDGVDQNCDGADVCYDLDCDGWPDLVFANATDGVSAAVDSHIYYGGPDGFAAARRAALPTVGAADVEIGDLDGDGYQDIVFANRFDGTSWTNPSYVYYGSPAGHSVADRVSLPTIGASGVEIADVDGDGMLDIVFSNQDDGLTAELDSWVYLGDPTDGFTVGNRLSLPTLGAWGNTVADLDGDGYQDIVFANHRDDTTRFVGSYLYWGSASGWLVADREQIPTVGARAVEHAHFDGDSGLDLVFTSHWDGATYGLDSNVWYQDGGGFWGFTGLPTQGGSGAAAGDLDGDGDIDLLLAHERDDAAIRQRDSFVYWNDGGFSPGDALALPGSGPGAVFAGDLDLDGHVDVVLANSQDDADEYGIDSFVYWGGPAGLSPTDVTLLPTHGAAGVGAAGPGLPARFSAP